MYYLATLVGREDGPAVEPGTPEFEAEVARYAEFDRRAGAAIAGGAALYPSAETITVRPGATPLVTDGPYPEQAEVVGGFYVFDCPDLDAAVELARLLPAARDGVVELRPMLMYTPHELPGPDWWLALLWSAADTVVVPDTPEWDASAVEHHRFAEKFADAVRGGSPLTPPDTATTVRVRDGKLLLSDGPFPEFAEVVDGLYLFTAPDRVAAAEIAAAIPIAERGHTEVRRIVELPA
ncbi:YciI family protein [Nocardia takedensis]